MESYNISKATLGRLPRYIAYLKSVCKGEEEFISAATIANALSLGEVQVRKDLAYVTTSGKPKVGYSITLLVEDLENFFSHSKISSAVVVTDGYLGKALLGYEGFQEYSVNISACFDLTSDDFETEFASYVRDNNIKIGIIAVSTACAQSVCDKMTENGIGAIWNFAPCRLNLPDDICLKQENLGLSLAYLQNQLTRRNQA